MARPVLAAPLLLLIVATYTAVTASDVTAEDDVTAELLASALKDVASSWPPQRLSEGELPLLLAGDWGRLAALSQPLPRARRAPQDDPPRQKKRRRKGRRRGGRRRKGRRRRPSTPATEMTPTSPPTTAAPVMMVTPAPTQQLPVARSGAWRRTTVTTTVTTTTPTTTTTTTTTTTPPPLPNYNVAPEGAINDRPVIGVLTQSLPGKLNTLVSDVDLSSYIDASCVKFLEGAGARVVPVMTDQSTHYYREMFRYLNGLLLPGGAADLQDSGYAAAARALWKISAEYSDDHFPILGIGQGMEMIARVVDERSSFKSCPANNLAGQLFIEPNGARSRLLAGAGDRVRDILSSQPATVTFHDRCLSPTAFRSGRLARDFSLVATSRDRDGRAFVSAMEHKRLPIFGVAFQPEKPQFEWSRADGSSSIPHTAEAILASQHLGNAFVAEVRRNRHRFPSSELEEDYLIFNYEPEFTGVMGSDFTSCYFF